MESLTGKRILVTGAAGSVGQAIIEKLVKTDAKEIIATDINETELFLLQRKHNGKIRAYVGNIGDRDFIFRIMKDIDIVIHAAAMKHVLVGEHSPDSIVHTNILGVQNLVDAAIEDDVDKFVFTSSDKAVNPTNVMGTSKLMGERMVTATNSKKRGKRTKLFSTRFGNVLGSRGGVFDIFLEQIKNKKQLTVTHEDMSRFVMSVEQAADLILQSLELARGGEVFVTKMPVVKIKDLAQAMVEEYAPEYGHDPEDFEITIIGKAAGEKMYEELMSDEEMARSHEHDDFFAILPAFRAVYHEADYGHHEKRKNPEKPYNSANEKPITIKEIRKFLREQDIRGDKKA